VRVGVRVRVRVRVRLRLRLRLRVGLRLRLRLRARARARARVRVRVRVSLTCWLRVRRFFVFSRPDVVEALISSFGPKQETETGKQPFCPSSSCNLSPIFLARTACDRTMDSARSVCSADSAW